MITGELATVISIPLVKPLTIKSTIFSCTQNCTVAFSVPMRFVALANSE